MWPIWMLAVMVGVAAGPVLLQGGWVQGAFAQGLIPPSRQYTMPKREGLDKGYGLPTFGTPGESMPKQRTATQEPKQEARPDVFKPMPSFARPDAPPADDTPDFFQKPSGLASSETGVPNFFADTPDAGRRKAGTASGGETPMFTTDEGGTTGDTSTGRLGAGVASDD